ncbi:MAG: DNA polymerase domain-containing protein [Candidatus Bathyarchaeia archaeon]
MVKGWILDAYPAGDNIVVWIKDERGQAKRLTEEYHPDIYIRGSVRYRRDLEEVLRSSRSVRSFETVKRRVGLSDNREKGVLRVSISDPSRRPFFARKVLRTGGYRKYELFNVDIPLAQLYLYERDLFPLAYVEARQKGKGEIEFKLLDSWKELDYRIPPLNSVWLRVNVKRRGIYPSFDDRIHGIAITAGHREKRISRGSEGDKLLRLVEHIAELDPDVVYTEHGDSFYMPYLAWRAKESGILEELVFGREATPLAVQPRKGGGRSYFSYGKIYYKPPPYYLLGRIHIDVGNSFIYEHCGMEGLIELARLTRVPIQRLSRATIGTGLTSMQMYQALRDGFLIPWRKRDSEAFKSAWDLLQADKGGFVFEPMVGFHANVGELDFVSMYPYIMAHHNISPETVLCGCCPDSGQRVPDIGYHICEKRVGLIPKVLRPLIDRRIRYKELRGSTRDRDERLRYDRRQAAIKWILVCCFGYLGYRNARFGRIEAHESVCAFGRDKLLRAVSIANRHGFKLVHGIVDALWIKKEGASYSDFISVAKEISERLEAPIDYVGRYRWLVLLPSKVHPGVGVLNRYYGVYSTGRIKVRGIEARRRDTPRLITQAQLGMIKALARARSEDQFVNGIPKALDVARGYVEKIHEGRADPNDLVISRQIYMRPAEYSHDVFQSIAARQLASRGLEPHPGEVVRYIVVNASARRPVNRVRAVEFYDPALGYDRDTYLRLLVMAVESILSPFGFNYRMLYDRLVHRVAPVYLTD